MVELCSVVAVNNSSFALIAESWFDSSIPDTADVIGNKSYNIYCRNRLTSGGGLRVVLAYVNTNIPTTRLYDGEQDREEVMWLLLKPTRKPRPFSSILIVLVDNAPG